MAKRKISAAMILAAGEDAHLKINENISHAKHIDGESFLELEVDSIENNPMQPRMHIDENELENLMHSIKQHGLIQPISVIKIDENRYVLKAGQRRLIAHKKLGFGKIKAIVQEELQYSEKYNEKILFEVAVLENIQRDNLNPVEFALSLHKVMQKGIYKNLDELSKALGKSKSYLSKVMKILNLDDEIIKDLGSNRSTNDVEALYEIQKIEDSNKQIEIYHDFVSKKLDRKSLKEALNTKKNIDTRHPYSIKKSNRKIVVEINLEKLDEEIKKSINDEIKEVLDKYLS